MEIIFQTINQNESKNLTYKTISSSNLDEMRESINEEIPVKNLDKQKIN